MGKQKMPRKAASGTLALFCDECETIVTRGSEASEGYLTLEGRRWRIFHDQCKPASNPVVVRESRLSSYSLLLTTVAGLAGEVNGFRDTNWPVLLRKIVADTEWYFDPEGGQMPARAMVAENKRIKIEAGLVGRYDELDQRGA